MRSGGRGTATRALLVATVLLCPAGSKAASLSERIEKLLGTSATTRAAFWGIQIVDLASGQTIYELNPERFFVAASNTKLFTTALALTRLGADFTFQTRVVAESAPDAEGRIHGSLVLAGGGGRNTGA